MKSVHEENIHFLDKIIGCHHSRNRLVKFGKTSTSRKRFKCTVCGKTFVFKKYRVKFSDFVAFAQYVTGMVNRKKIMVDKDISRPTLNTQFKPFFDHPLTATEVWNILPPNISKNTEPWVYGVDGKWLKRQGVILIHRDVTHRENLFWSFHKSESFEALSEDLEKLTNLILDSSGNLPIGAISDWKSAILASVGSFFGPIPHQRCLSHVIRLAKHLLPKNSPVPATLKLREIALELKNIANHKQKTEWQEQLKHWQQNYKYLLKEKTLASPGHQKKWWYTHGNLRRGFRLLTKDQDSLFVFLDNKLIPKSNNSLEGINSQLDQKLGDHRGIKLNQQVSFAFWHLTFGGDASDIPKLHKLWDYWKKHFVS